MAGGAGSDDIAVTGEVGGSMGCGNEVRRSFTVTEVGQDPSGTIEVGDTMTIRTNESSGASCGIDITAGDTLTVWGPGPDLAANLCNSVVN